MPPNTFPSSTLNLNPLQEYDTPALLDIRPYLGQLGGPSGNILREMLERVQFAFDNIQETLRGKSPGLSYLQVDAADIASLFVGSEFGPGQLAVFGGPPSYAGAGWIGTALDATPISITDITSDVVTTATDHGLKVNAAVLIEGTVTNDGYYIVDTVPNPDEFTVTGGFAGDTTGGEMTRLFQGGWLAQFACGGTYFGDAPFRVDVDGTLSITDALISLNGTGATITLDPNDGSITILEETVGPPQFRTILADGIITLDQVGAGDYLTIITAAGAVFQTAAPASGGSYQLNWDAQIGGEFRSESLAASQGLVHFGAYTAATEYGPLVSLRQRRGTLTSPTATQSGDTIGGLVGFGHDGSDETSYAAGFRVVATENHAGGAQGTRLVFETTPNAAAAPAVVAIIDQSGFTRLGGNTAPAYAADVTGDGNVSGVYRVAGTQVVKARMLGIAAPAGGGVIDVQARAAIVALINTLSFAAGGHGLIA
jgi:hypothetical protein